MTWEIKPFEGVGPIRFGMTPRQVERFLGQPSASARAATEPSTEVTMRLSSITTPGG